MQLYLDGSRLREFLERERVEMGAMLAELGLHRSDTTKTAI